MPEAIALPDIALLLAAVALLLVAAALWVFRELLVQSLGRLPVVGGIIVRTLGRWLDDARHAIFEASKWAFDAAGRLLEWAYRWWERFTIAEWEFSLRAAQGIYHLVRVTVPNAEVRAIAYGIRVVDAAEARINRTIVTVLLAVTRAFDRVENRITSVAATLALDAARLYDAAIRFTRSEIVAVERWAAAELAAASTVLRRDIAALAAAVAADVRLVERYAASLFDRAEQDIANAEAQAEAFARATTAATARVIYTDLETWGTKAVEDAWPDAEQELAHLGQTLGGDFPWLKDLLGALGGLGAAGLLGTLIRSMATAQALTRLADDCIVPQCRNLGGLSNDLANLSALFAAGTMFAWIADGVADPDGWARDVSSVLGPVGERATDQAKSTFGVG